MEILLPKLRFSEFNGNLNYSYKKQSFEDVFLFSTGKNIKQDEASPEFDTLCVRYGELYHMYNEVINVIINRTNLNKSELIFSQGDEILLPSAGEDPLDIGSASALTVANVAIGRTINILKPLKQNVYSNIYAAYYINHKLRAKIATLAKGVSISNVYNSDLKTLEIILPSLKEQTKISNFLASVDEKLNLLKEKKELLVDYKKGIMQKIFNQEIRFKNDNGDDFEDWIETNLGGICEFENGKAHENEIDENGDFVVINSKFVSTNGRVRKYTNKIISRLDKNDIVMVMSDVPNGKAIAKCYYVEEDNKYSLNQRICKIRVVKNDSKYIYYLINRNPYYLAFDSGVGQTNLRKDEVLDCPLYIPKDIKEQNKIANFLTSIDEKIELVSNQIQDSQEYKKGLLQQMFI